MPYLVGALLSGLIQIVGTLVGRVLVSLGLGLVTYTGVSASLNYLKSSAVSAALGLGPDVVGMLSILKVGVSINVIFSAMLARLVIQGLQGDTLKKWVTK